MAKKITASILWNNIPVEITFTRHVFGLEHDHVELRASEPLPVTETGYRSQFLPHDPDVDLDDIKAQVFAWLDEKSTDKTWLEYQQNSRQGNLFDF